MAFIATAYWEDAGKSACQSLFELGLPELVTDFLGEGPWEPDPERWGGRNSDMSGQKESQHVLTPVNSSSATASLLLEAWILASPDSAVWAILQPFFSQTSVPIDQKISAFISNALHLLAGIMIGTAVSFPLNGIPFAYSYLLALVLFPVSLTLLLSFELRHDITWIGITTVIGLSGAILCSIQALSEKNGRRWRLGTLSCGILWSLGSAFAMEVMMGV